MYKSVIKEASCEISKIEAVALKNMTDAVGIDTIINDSVEGYAVIYPEKYVIVEVHNDMARDSQDYEVLIIVDKDGTKYKTGSNAFIRSFLDIFEELGGEEGWGLKVFGRESKNYNGKKFLTCSVVF